MLTAAKIKGRTFDTVKNGFDPDEVRFFLAEVAKDFDAILDANEQNDQKLAKLAEKIEQYREDEDAIKNALILSQKEANKILSEAKAQARDMIDSAKIEQMRLCEQSAADCERMIQENQENCDRRIKEQNDATEKKIAQIKAEYEQEQANLKELKQEVTMFKANLLELYKRQLSLVMEMPAFEAADTEEAAEEELLDAVVYDEADAVIPDEQEKAAETKEEQFDKALNAGPVEPVISKENLQDLRFGKNN